jgi:hypothetical protein
MSIDAATRRSWQAWDRRETEAGRIGPLGVLGLIKRSGGGPIDVRVRAPLSRWQTTLSGGGGVEHPRVWRLCRLHRARHVRPGPRQRAGEITLLKPGGSRLSRRMVEGYVLVSVLRTLADHGLIYLARNPNTGLGYNNGPISMISSANRPWIVPIFGDKEAQP